jgi:hypothetical protein
MPAPTPVGAVLPCRNRSMVDETARTPALMEDAMSHRPLGRYHCDTSEG